MCNPSDSLDMIFCVMGRLHKHWTHYYEGSTRFWPRLCHLTILANLAKFWLDFWIWQISVFVDNLPQKGMKLVLVYAAE